MRHRGRWLEGRNEHSVEPKARGEASSADGLEMDIARAGIVGVANEQVHISDDGSLIREVANVGAEIFRHVIAR